jgi:hypothetical protein
MPTRFDTPLEPTTTQLGHIRATPPPIATPLELAADEPGGGPRVVISRRRTEGNELATSPPARGGREHGTC